MTFELVYSGSTLTTGLLEMTFELDYTGSTLTTGLLEMTFELVYSGWTIEKEVALLYCCFTHMYEVNPF